MSKIKNVKALFFNAPPSSNGIYTKMLKEVSDNEPKTEEEQQNVISLLNRLINDSEIPYDEKMIYLFSFVKEIQNHSYGIDWSIE